MERIPIVAARLACLCGAVFALNVAVADAATIPVTDGGNAGAGTLRAAIETAEGNGVVDTIEIQVATVQLLTALPDLTTEIEIEGKVAGAKVRGLGEGSGFRVFNVTGSADVSISDITIENGATSSGAGIENAGQLTLDHVVVTGNRGEGLFVVGGAVYNTTGTLTMTDSAIENNQNVAEIFALGGGLTSNGTATLIRTNVSVNFLVVPAIGAAGSAYGAGIYNGASGTMTIKESTVSSNTAAIGLQSGSADIVGGGIASQGDLTIERSTINNNVGVANTSNKPGSEAKVAGGGIGLFGGGELTIKSSTLTDNKAFAAAAATTSATGGGIAAVSGSTATFLLGSTIDANAVGAGTANVGANLGGPLTLTAKSTILSDPSGDPSCEGLSTPASEGFNLDEDSSCLPSPAATDIQGADPKLGALKDNGGPTETQAIPVTSPALDHGIATDAGGADQRGKPRPADLVEAANAAGGDGSDIGAYEYQPSADLSVTQTDSPDPAVTEDEITYTVVVENNGPDTATEVVAIDTLPAGTSLVGASPACEPFPEEPDPLTCDLGTLASGEEDEFQVTVHADSPGNPQNEVSVQSDIADPDTPDNVDDETTTIDPSADLSIEMSDAPDPLFVGEQIAYTLIAHNAGPDAAEEVTAELALPAGMSLVSAPAGCKHLSGVVSCELGTVAAGASPVVGIAGRADAAGQAKSEAIVYGPTHDPDSSNNSAATTTTVQPRPVAPSPPRKARCGGIAATIVGSSRSEKLKGTKKRDVIAGLGGNDRVFGRAGNDLICGGAGNDKLFGGPGNDRLLGGPGKDVQHQ